MYGRSYSLSVFILFSRHTGDATMHRALCISEILREVLLYAADQCVSDANRGNGYVCPWHASGDELAYCMTSCAYDVEAKLRRPTPRRRFLRAAALSCKTFSGVALDLLWRVLDSAEPLGDLQKYFVSVVRGPASTYSDLLKRSYRV